jgi:hypothetical protein
MSKWETCEIRRVTVRETKSGFFGIGDRVGAECWEARIVSPSGSQIIYKSTEFQTREEMDVAHSSVTTRLLSEGWEPTATDRGGYVSLMKRQVETTTQVPINNANLLQQLANLRDAGILTEQEFQAKKAEILRRM